jgi:hypothetical protein
MRRVVVAIGLLIVTHGVLSGQNQTARTLTSNDIITRIGGEVDVRNVIAAVLTHAMQGHRREYFLASQMRAEWLPVVQGVEYVRLADEEIAAHLAACGRYWIVGLERSGNVVSMRLGQRCGGTVLEYIVSFDGREWRLGSPDAGKNGSGWGPGIGSGFFGGRPPECVCP